MKKLYTAVDRFCARNPRFGVPDLMRWIVIGNVAVYVLMLLTMRADANALSFLYLDGGKVLRGEIWRIITFIFVPASSSPLWLAISLYFYYWIGTSLERQWGTARFNLYYWSGVLLTAIVTIVASAISGTGYPVGGTEYVNLSMFLAFAFLFPDTRLLLFCPHIVFHQIHRSKRYRFSRFLHQKQPQIIGILHAARCIFSALIPCFQQFRKLFQRKLPRFCRFEQCYFSTIQQFPQIQNAFCKCPAHGKCHFHNRHRRRNSK